MAVRRHRGRQLQLRVLRVQRHGAALASSAFGLARAHGRDMHFTRVLQPPSVLPFLPYAIVPRHTAATVNGSDGFLYFFYLQRPTLASSNVYLARLQEGDIASPDQRFSFWTGNSYAFRDDMAMADSPPVVVGAFSQVSVAWNKVRRWVK